MRGLVLALVTLLSACGTTDEVVRPTAEVVYLKLKGDVARELFEDLAGAAEPMACPESGRPCKRQGESLICSTANVRDRWVCEVRFDAADGAVIEPAAELYHSAEDNRFPLVSERRDDRIVLVGDGAAELRRRFADGEGDEVELRVVDPGEGVLEPLTW